MFCKRTNENPFALAWLLREPTKTFMHSHCLRGSQPKTLVHSPVLQGTNENVDTLVLFSEGTRGFSFGPLGRAFLSSWHFVAPVSCVLWGGTLLLPFFQALLFKFLCGFRLAFGKPKILFPFFGS